MGLGAHEYQAGSADLSFTHWRPMGNIIVGWLDGQELYLDPDAAYRAAQELASRQGEGLQLSKGQLFRRLKEGGYLASFEPDRATQRVQRGSSKRVVLHLRSATLCFPKTGETGETGEP